MHALGKFSLIRTTLSLSDDDVYFIPGLVSFIKTISLCLWERKWKRVKVDFKYF